MHLLDFFDFCICRVFKSKWMLALEVSVEMVSTASYLLAISFESFSIFTELGELCEQFSQNYECLVRGANETIVGYDNH